MIEIIPILPVKSGKIVDFHYEGRIVTGRDFHEIHVVLNHLNQIYASAYFMDMDGIRNGDLQLELLKELCELHTLYTDPGVRNEEDVIDPLVAGSRWVALSTLTMDSLEVVNNALEISDSIVPLIVWADGRIQHQYRTEQEGIEDIRYHLEFFKDAGMESVLFMDMDTIRQREGYDRHILDSLLESGLNVYIAGGVGEKDALRLQEMGVKGILIYINDILNQIFSEKPRRIPVMEPEKVKIIEPAVQLNPIGLPDYG